MGGDVRGPLGKGAIGERESVYILQDSVGGGWTECGAVSESKVCVTVGFGVRYLAWCFDQIKTPYVSINQPDVTSDFRMIFDRAAFEYPSYLMSLRFVQDRDLSLSCYCGDRLCFFGNGTISH